MIVVSDTTAITNLHQIDLLYILKDLYGQILIPTAVYQELSAFSNQKEILDKAEWITVQAIVNQELLQNLIKELDQGEAESIILANETNCDLLIIDEQKGRFFAKQFDLRVIGLLGILMNAKTNGLIDEVKPYLTKLKEEIGFHISNRLFNEILKRVEEN